MDDQRFDAWVRRMWAGSSRRSALRAIAGGVVAGGFGLLGARGTAAETQGGSDATCRCSKAGTKENPNRFCRSERCDRDDQCCSGKCVRVTQVPDTIDLSCEGDKVCLCRNEGAQCAKDCACCSGNCKNGRCARR